MVNFFKNLVKFLKILPSFFGNTLFFFRRLNASPGLHIAESAAICYTREMPIKIQSGLPANKVLEAENVFVMTDQRAATQDIRPLKIAIVNLMPTKIATETQLLRLLANSPLQVEVFLVSMAGHVSRHTSQEHLNRFYISSNEVFHKKFDGMIITGAPLEQMEFENVDYWHDLCDIMDYARENVFCTLYICWAALAGLYHLHGIRKGNLTEKISGIFMNHRTSVTEPLLRGFDDVFPMPQSRYSTVNPYKVKAHAELEILAESDEAGISIVKSVSNREIFVTGHLEYDTDTLKQEYFRDEKKGIRPRVPRNYFPHDDPLQEPQCTWRSTASLFFSNWLNYYVYQETPYAFVDLQYGDGLGI